MDIDHPEPRDREDLRLEDVTVGHDDADVGLGVLECAMEYVTHRAIGLDDIQCCRERNGLHRGWDERGPGATLRAIGLGDDEDDLEPRVEEGLERGDRELRGAEEGDPHHSPAGAGSVGCSWT